MPLTSDVVEYVYDAGADLDLAQVPLDQVIAF